MTKCPSISDIVHSEESCIQITTHFLDEISAKASLGATISVDPHALLEAAALDNVPKISRGKLHCVPILVKDNIDVQGLPTTNGLFAFKAQIPLTDAKTVAQLRAEGAMILGKSNMSPLADKELWGHSETGGLIRNPYDTDRTTYGSSGGAGAAGGACLSVINLGTETGVSINMPSAASNQVGVRAPVFPTPLISREGVFPNQMFQDITGPMAKRAIDVAKAFAVLRDASVDVPDMTAPEVLKKNLTGLRINIWSVFAYQEFSFLGYTWAVEPVVQKMFNHTVDVLRSLGATVNIKEQTQEEFDNTMNAFLGVAVVDVVDCVKGWRNSYLGDTERFPVSDTSLFHDIQEVADSNTLPAYYQHSFEKTLEGDADKCDHQTASYVSAQSALQSAATALLSGADLLLLPMLPSLPGILPPAAFPLPPDWADTTGNMLHAILFGSWTGWSSMALPMGLTEPNLSPPLPASAWMLARPKDLSKLFTAAYAFQEAFPDSLGDPNPTGKCPMPDQNFMDDVMDMYQVNFTYQIGSTTILSVECLPGMAGPAPLLVCQPTTNKWVILGKACEDDGHQGKTGKQGDGSDGDHVHRDGKDGKNSDDATRKDGKAGKDGSDRGKKASGKVGKGRRMLARLFN
eukprot:gb/GEZN01003003.1/.p1 GENE.gb/GEZN01003003.1/~~gb/GEZN01003003.1/.p1  ORF type:complete len:679 (+),score=84.46 gb/GEZN01003003.1/:146-2038(+)